MKYRALVFLLGLVCGTAYMLAGGSFLGWNAAHGYLTPFVDWALAKSVSGGLLRALIYVHDAVVFFVLALAFSLCAIPIIPARQMVSLLAGILVASIAVAWVILRGPVSIGMATAFVVVVLPLPAMLIARRLLDARWAHAARNWL